MTVVTSRPDFERLMILRMEEAKLLITLARKKVTYKHEAPASESMGAPGNSLAGASGLYRVCAGLRCRGNIDHKNDWDGAYYLAGYAVEFALKICIISQLMKSNSFPDKKLAENFYKHDLAVLRRAAGLEDEMNKDAAVSLHWDVVKDWTEQSRYRLGATEQDARDLYDAIENGVVPWIKARW